MRKFLVSGVAALAAAFMVTSSLAAEIQVIHSEIPGHPTATIPGALDAAGNPVLIEFKAVEAINFSPDGSRWILRGRANADATIDTFLLIGSELTSGMLAQEARPVLGGQPNEVYDFFDETAGFNEDNEYAFGARARGGVAAVAEKVLRVASTSGVVANQGAALSGALDLPPAPSGDELLGNSLNGIHILNDERVGFVDLSTTNIHSSRRPLLAYASGASNQTFLQSGVTAVGGSVWDSFSTDGFTTTPDGAHYVALGDDEGATTQDRIFVYDGNVVVRENTVIAGTGIIAADIFQFQLLADGTWLARGDDTAPDNDWALRDGVLLAKTGDPITTGSGENWGDTFLALAGNRSGDWVLSGNTSSADPASDAVIVLNGTDVVVRENDPIDLNGNGQFDDDVFIGRGVNTNPAFSANELFLSDDGILYFIAPLRNAAGNDLGSIPAFGSGGEAFLRLDLELGGVCGPCADSNCDGTVTVSDIGFFVAAVTGGQSAWAAGFPGGQPPCDFLCANDTNGDNAVTVADIGLFVAVLTGEGACGG